MIPGLLLDGLGHLLPVVTSFNRPQEESLPEIDHRRIGFHPRQRCFSKQRRGRRRAQFLEKLCDLRPAGLDIRMEVAAPTFFTRWVAGPTACAIDIRLPLFITDQTRDEAEYEYREVQATLGIIEEDLVAESYANLPEEQKTRLSLRHQKRVIP